ncbi:unnamed protein product [Caenorhabditis auriculariae]|uniref:tRNA-dihydrouridine(47) synthase [NAD(P)(+)] n=1 Tax=Caenorhabditis auriculariae TaxID=2777116 RepID=A0A8S1HHM4_9PELO|nr:unnamed protein product [Caenorhabditis auriculariae]
MTEELAEPLKEEEKGYRDASIAPLIPEFIIPKDQLPVEDFKEDRKPKNERRGINKNRRKEMKHAETNVRANSLRLCPSVIQPVACKFGEKCTSEHDIKSILREKTTGYSRRIYACRFGNAHMDSKAEQIEKTPEIEYSPTLNTSSIQIQMALRKKEFDFGRCEEALKMFKEEKLGSMESEPRKLSMESLSGLKYLAPLTTVGNLPFRRLCVEYGADITCSEMLIATNLLMGSPSEYALLKRHPCEKIFGVQLAGGYADTMSKAAQIIVDNYEVDFLDINMGCPIDLINQKGGGCALPTRPTKMLETIATMKKVMKGCPLTVKLRTGLKEGNLKAHETVALMKKDEMTTPDLITFHPRSKEQRYSRLANWDFTFPVAQEAGKTPFWACGDVLSWEDYCERLETYPIQGVMIGRGALIKPWIFTEIDERRTWDISSKERFDMLTRFVGYGLDHWGSDDSGVERTRKFLLELLSFQCRYIPAGILEVLPQKINDRPPRYRGRDDLETLLSSPRAEDWIAISKMLLGPTPEGFTFIPKHKASSY